APLNSTMIAVALPAIMLAYGASLASAGWLVTSYLVVMAALQPVAGKLGDQLGRRPFILGGLAGFGLASLGALIAPSLSVLVLFRLLQATCAAIALPNGVALVREVVPEQRRAAAFGLVGAAISVAAAAGPPLGGLLVSTAGWQAIFYFNVPLVLIALLLGWRVLPRQTLSRRGQGFDLLGAVLLCSVLVGISLVLRASGAASVLPILLGGVVLLLIAALFVVRELHHPEPVFHPRFFLRRSFAAATAAVALSNLAMYSTILALPVILTRQAHWTSSHVGLVLTALSAGNVVFTPFGGRLADRYGRRAPVVGGLALFTLALLPLLREASGFSGPALTLSLAVAGAGLGIANPGMQTAAVEAVAAREAGAASGMYSTSRYLGSIIGSSVLPILLTASLPTTAATERVFALIILAAGCSAAVSLALRGKQRG
ncbi:MAG TPA: MFS transporter, partial [Chloroflexota bacterium]|nr:MFS transporter [Chloroflexota bacterium]